LRSRRPLVARRFGKRADHGDGFGLSDVEWQEVSVILQQRQAFAGGPPGQGIVAPRVERHAGAGAGLRPSASPPTTA
jgi:hypothetical protein